MVRGDGYNRLPMVRMTNVGLLAGDLAAAVRRVMLCIDLMPPVVDEALAANLVEITEIDQGGSVLLVLSAGNADRISEQVFAGLAGKNGNGTNNEDEGS